MTVDETKQGGLGIAVLFYVCCVHQKSSLSAANEPKSIMPHYIRPRLVFASRLGISQLLWPQNIRNDETLLLPSTSRPIQSHKKPRLSGFWSRVLRALLKVAPLRPNNHAFWRRVGIGIHAAANAGGWGGNFLTCPLKDVITVCSGSTLVAATSLPGHPKIQTFEVGNCDWFYSMLAWKHCKRCGYIKTILVVSSRNGEVCGL